MTATRSCFLPRCAPCLRVLASQRLLLGSNTVQRRIHKVRTYANMLFFVLLLLLLLLGCVDSLYHISLLLDSELLVIHIINVSEAGQSHLKVRISCQSMDLAAELVQDLARYFQLEELESEADFPAELQAFEEVRWNLVLFSCIFCEVYFTRGYLLCVVVFLSPVSVFIFYFVHAWL